MSTTPYRHYPDPPLRLKTGDVVQVRAVNVHRKNPLHGFQRDMTVLSVLSSVDGDRVILTGKGVGTMRFLVKHVVDEFGPHLTSGDKRFGLRYVGPSPTVDNPETP